MLMPDDLVDTHCHLTFKDLAVQQDRVVADALAAGVSRMITVVCRGDDIGLALALRKRHPCVWVSAGIHPHEAQLASREEIDRLAASWRGPGVVACGEMGLDYHYDFSPRDVQQTVFDRQLELAADTQLPVVIHCRQAHSDTVRILTKHGYVGKNVVFHCFSGTPDEAAELRANGWWTSFSGILTFKNATDPQQVVADAPIDQLLFETDAPYLSPEPVRRMRPNEPQNVAHTIRFAAMLRGQTFESVAAAGTANAIRFFKLDQQ